MVYMEGRKLKGEQRRNDGQRVQQDDRIDPARKPENDFLGADPGAYFRHCLVGVGRHRPVAPAAANIADKTLEDRFALRRMRHLGMKLDRVVAAGFIHHGGNRRCFIARHQREARW